jgi:small conductance mechanosensitive channel
MDFMDANTWIEMAINIAFAIAIFIIGRIMAGATYSLVVRLIRKRNLDELIGRFVANIAKYTVLGFAIIAALERLGIQTTSIVAIFGAAGLAVGLALQGNLSNFASGVMLLVFRPFELGDVVTAAGHTGQVTDIGLFTSTFETPDNQKIIIPNAAITGSSIINLTTKGVRGQGVSIGVAYGTDLHEAGRVILEAVKSADLVLENPAPSVVCTGFGASSVDFLAKYCVTTEGLTANGGHQHPHNVRVAIYDALNAAGIEIPFEQIVLHHAEVAAAAEGDDEAAAG